MGIKAQRGAHVTRKAFLMSEIEILERISDLAGKASLQSATQPQWVQPPDAVAWQMGLAWSNVLQ